MRPRRSFLVLLLLAFFWAVFIWSNSLQTGTASSQVSEGVAEGVVQVAEWLSGLPFDVTKLHGPIRKAGHLAEFALFGILASAVCNAAAVRRSFLIPILSGALVAVADEGIQYFVPGRSAQLSDVLLDVFGVLAGALLTKFIIMLMEKRRARRRME